ncbi:hypothetical protein C8J57DRAFT_1058205, partial [Mycena rebaudengoi]
VHRAPLSIRASELNLKLQKCDARRPICGPCVRFPTGGLQDCEYTEMGPAQAQLLEEQISIVQSRIQDLEKPPELRTSVGLSDPYTQQGMGHHSQNRSSRPPISYERSGIPASSSASSVPFCFDLILCPERAAERFQKSVSIRLMLHFSRFNLRSTRIHNFLRHASQIGLFLEPQLFEDLASGARPVQSTSPFLLNTVCLWGAHFSRTDSFSVHEPGFLASALQNTTGGLQSANGVVHAIQAEVLVANYLFRHARILEAKYHASAAVSLALSGGLHKTRSSELRSSTMVSALAPPKSPLEEGERINAFWAVLTLNNCWCTADGSPSNISYAVHGIDTPWPLNVRDYHKNSHILPFQSSDTVGNFLANRPDNGTSVPALYAKAAILFEQASRLAGRFTESVAHRRQNIPSSAEFRCFEGVIESFKRAIPSAQGNASRTALVIHTLVHVSTIQLHNPFVLTHAASQACAISAARSIVTLLRHTDVHEFGFVDAIMGTLWTAACQVFITELSRSRNSPSKFMEEHRDSLKTLLEVMSVFSVRCPLIGAYPSSLLEFLCSE